MSNVIKLLMTDDKHWEKCVNREKQWLQVDLHQHLTKDTLQFIWQKS